MRFMWVVRFILAWVGVLYSGNFLVAEGEDVDSTTSLSNTFKDAFYIGVALNSSQIQRENAQANNVIARQFNAITAENSMKWESLNPEKGIYTFDEADKFVSMGVEQNKFVVGHVLVWHEQTPAWVFENEDGNLASREVLLARMKEHIQTVMSRYKGRVNGWDVVNEALNEDGSLRDSRWRKAIGDDYIEKAFEFAHAADPAAELYYNDYNLFKQEKCKAAVKLMAAIRDKGIPVKGIGLQGHYGIGYPDDLSKIDASINAIGEAGFKAMITELDISVLPFPEEFEQGADITYSAARRAMLDPYIDGLPSGVDLKLAEAYTRLFRIYLDNKDIVSRVTFWGLNDAQSWRNYWPMAGRTDYPLLFSRDYQAKSAYFSIINLREGEYQSGE